MTPITRPYPICEVVWMDAIGDSETRKASEPLKPKMMISVGYLVYSDDKYINLAQDVACDNIDEIDYVGCVPEGWILKKNITKIRKINLL